MRLAKISRDDFSIWKQFREALYKSVDDKFNLEEMDNIFNSKDWHCQFIESEDNKKIGMVEISYRNIVDGCLSSPVAYLEGIYLQAEYRNQGIGTQVMLMVMQWCSERGFSELATDTGLANNKAQAFYTSLGFEETDRVVEYRIDINHD